MKNMSNKGFNGKAIYNPQGKAGEYSQWACNFYNGCSNDCEYCYCKRGVMSHVWSNKPTLKKCFKNTDDALYIFSFELHKMLRHLRDSSLFFTFTSDPFLPKVKHNYYAAAEYALINGVPVQFLTKRADFVHDLFFTRNEKYKDHIAIGFTLTGHDELEPGASSNHDRIEAMKFLHGKGFRTFASIEPIISVEGSKQMILETLGSCDLYKIGLRSGVSKDYYNDFELGEFMIFLADLCNSKGVRMYIKESLRNRVCGKDTILAFGVGSDYDIFRDK